MTGRREIIQYAPLLRVVPWYVAGILVGDSLAINMGLWPAVAVLVLALLLYRWKYLQGLAIGACVALLAMVLTVRHRQSLDFAADAVPRVVRAMVVSEAVEKPRTMAVDLLLPDEGRRVKAYVQKDERSRMLQPGSGLQLRTRVECVRSMRIGTFDYGRYLAVHGFSGRCYVRSSDWTSDSSVWERLSRTERLRVKALTWRHHLLLRLRQLSADDDEVYGLLAAMTLGQKTSLSAQLRDVYAAVGASHVLALSGLHMGILFCLLSMLPLMGRRSVLSRMLLVLLCWAFALLTGLSVSIVRSALMLSIFALMSLRGGRNMSVGVLSLAAIIILLLNPYALYDVGFQLSFLSVFSILMILPLLESFWPEGFLLRHGLIRLVWSLMAVGVAAQIGVAPLIAYYFGTFPLFFVLTNLVAIPCTYGILWLSFAFMVVPVAWLGQLLLVVVRWLNDALAVMAAWPHATIAGLHPSVMKTTMAYVVIVVVYLVIARMKNIRIKM